LKNACSIIVTTKGDKNNLIRKGIAANKISIIFNGADTTKFVLVSEQKKIEIRKKYKISTEKKVMVYFGSYNYGMNDIEILGDSLRQLGSEKNRFQFISIGDGSLKNSFINKIKNLIDFKDFSSLSSEDVNKIVSACDVSIIPRKKIKLDTGGNVPVKCYESLAAGVPFILSINEDDESSHIFENCPGAFLVPAGEKNALFNEVLRIIKTNSIQKLGLKGRDFIINNFDRSKQTEKLIYIVKNLSNNY
jgi:glycosyltransferase involved in cell wall biosynthesis